MVKDEKPIKLAFFLFIVLIALFLPIVLSADEPVFYESFEGGIMPDGWSTDARSGNPWQVVFSRHHSCDGEYSLVCSGDRESISDSWCYSRDFSLKKGIDYMLSFYIKTKLSFSPESIAVSLIKSGGGVYELFSDKDFKDSQCRSVQKEFSVDSDGLYRLAIRYFSGREGKKLFLDNPSIRKVMSLRVEPEQLFYDIASERLEIKLINSSRRELSLKISHENKSNAILLPEKPVIIGPLQETVLYIRNLNKSADWWANEDALIIESHDGEINKKIRIIQYANRWRDMTPVSPLPFSDFALGAARDSSHIYVFGGFASSVAARFDPASQKWEMLTPPPEAEPEPYSAVYYDGAFYFMSSRSNTLYRYVYSSDGGNYAKITGPDGFRADEHFRRPSMVEFAGIIYVMGHINSPGPYDIRFCQYEISTGQWKELPLPRNPRMLCGMAVKNGIIYVMGGMNRNYHEIGDGEAFDIFSGLWLDDKLPSVPGGSGYPGILLSLGGYLFFDRGRMENELYVYRPGEGAQSGWAALRPKPSFNFYSGSVMAGGSIHLMGGTVDVPLSKGCTRNVHYIMEIDRLVADAGAGGLYSHGDSRALGRGTIAVGGKPPYEYYWADGSGWESRDKTPVYEFRGTGKKEISLTVIDSEGISDTDSAVYYSERQEKHLLYRILEIYKEYSAKK